MGGGKEDNDRQTKWRYVPGMLSISTVLNYDLSLVNSTKLGGIVPPTCPRLHMYDTNKMGAQDGGSQSRGRPLRVTAVAMGNAKQKHKID